MAQVLTSRINLRCKNDNALLVPEHGIISNSNTSTTFLSCPECPRRVKVVSVYDGVLDAMVLYQAFEKNPGDIQWQELELPAQTPRQRKQEAEA